MYLDFFRPNDRVSGGVGSGGRDGANPYQLRLRCGNMESSKIVYQGRPFFQTSSFEDHPTVRKLPGAWNQRQTAPIKPPTRIKFNAGAAVQHHGGRKNRSV